MAKFRTAGMPTKAPSAKQKVSVMAEKRIEGPIRPSALEILTSTTSSGWLMFTRSNSWTIKKILSTPTARTMKGMTSTMMSVALRPIQENRPIEEAIDISTIAMPTTPSVNLDSTSDVAGLRMKSWKDSVVEPNAIDAYRNMIM